MQPIGIWIHDDGEWSILHRCRQCGIIKHNRIAGDDSELALFALAARPMARMPFPSDRLFDELQNRIAR